MTHLPELLAQVVGVTPGLGRALIMLLLLAGLLSIEGNRRRYVPWVILAGIVPSLVTDVHDIEPAWPFISALVVPPLMWQVAIRVTAAQPPARWQDLLTWLLTAALVGLALIVVAGLPLASALLLSLLVVSLVWQVRERAADSTHLSTFGHLTLAFLLAEVDLVSLPAGETIGAIFSGVGFGLILGLVGVRVALRLPEGEPRRLLFLALSYAAYLVGLLPAVSGVAAVVMTGLMAARGCGFATGRGRRVWRLSPNSPPAPESAQRQNCPHPSTGNRRAARHSAQAPANCHEPSARW